MKKVKIRRVISLRPVLVFQKMKAIANIKHEINEKKNRKEIIESLQSLN